MAIASSLASPVLVRSVFTTVIFWEKNKSDIEIKKKELSIMHDSWLIDHQHDINGSQRTTSIANDTWCHTCCSCHYCWDCTMSAAAQLTIGVTVWTAHNIPDEPHQSVNYKLRKCTFGQKRVFRDSLNFKRVKFRSTASQPLSYGQTTQRMLATALSDTTRLQVIQDYTTCKIHEQEEL